MRKHLTFLSTWPLLSERPQDLKRKFNFKTKKKYKINKSSAESTSAVIVWPCKRKERGDRSSMAVPPSVKPGSIFDSDEWRANHVGKLGGGYRRRTEARQLVDKQEKEEDEKKEKWKEKNKKGKSASEWSLMQTAVPDSDRQVLPGRWYRFTAPTARTGYPKVFERERERARIELCTNAVAKLSSIQHFFASFSRPVQRQKRKRNSKTSLYGEGSGSRAGMKETRRMDQSQRRKQRTDASTSTHPSLSFFF